MPAGEDGRQDPVDHLVLADDALSHLGPEALDGADESLELLDVVLGDALRCGHG